MINIYSTKTKLLASYESLQKSGAIAEYRLTELRLEMLDLDLKISETKKSLVDMLLELHFISGIKISI